MRLILKPLIPLYAIGLARKNRRFDEGALAIHKLAKPVISVGSLSAGGAGKTPVVVALLQMLKQHGLIADVLSRGYGRTVKDTLHVDAKGDAADYGDETLMIAQQGWDVFVSPQRYDAGRLAEQQSAADLHLLDDGMQHRQLHRDVNIALLTLEDANDLLLPAGNLREPLTNLRRANVVIMREDEAPQLGPVVHHYAPLARRWVVRRELHVGGPAPERAFAFCGIARPQNFYSMLRLRRVPIVAQRSFRDHHSYTAEDIESILEQAKRVHADAMLTTEKDAVKLAGRIPELRVAELRTTFVDEELVWADLHQLLQLHGAL